MVIKNKNIKSWPEKTNPDHSLISVVNFESITHLPGREPERLVLESTLPIGRSFFETKTITIFR